MVKVFTFFSLIIFIFCADSAVFAQEEINVRSLTITRGSQAAPIKFDLRAINSLGQSADYFVHDSTAILGFPQYERCNPCSPPQLFNTNVFSNPISVQIGQTSVIIYFHLASAESTPAYLGSRLFSRKGEFSISGATKLKGRIEIVDRGVSGGRILAFDNDVELEGRYTIRFYKPTITPSGKKITDFKSIEYILCDSREPERELSTNRYSR